MTTITNEALLISKPAWNAFTLKLAEVLKERGEVEITARGGFKFQVAHLDMSEQAFFNRGYTHCWNLDGTSVTAPSFDIITFEV